MLFNNKPAPSLLLEVRKLPRTIKTCSKRKMGFALFNKINFFIIMYSIWKVVLTSKLSAVEITNELSSRHARKPRGTGNDAGERWIRVREGMWNWYRCGAAPFLMNKTRPEELTFQRRRPIVSLKQSYLCKFTAFSSHEISYIRHA